MPILSEILNLPHSKEKAAEEMSKIAQILNEDECGKHILTIVLELAHDDTNEENRTIAVKVDNFKFKFNFLFYF